MRKILITVLFALCLLGLSSCSANDYMGFDKRDFTVVTEVDTHGGFFGDGFYFLTLDCSMNRENALEHIKDWEKLPLSVNLGFAVYGGEKDGIGYGPLLAETVDIPQIEHGYFCFTDRQSEGADNHSDAELFNRYSYNFTLAIYDTDTDRMYYWELDT